MNYPLILFLGGKVLMLEVILMAQAGTPLDMAEAGVITLPQEQPEQDQVESS
jgi:hypothetical protein